MTATARIVVGIVDADVFAPYGFKDIIKEFPSRRWDATRRCWRIDVVFADEMADTLRRAGATVYLTRPDGTPWKSGRPEHGHRDRPADGWADALFAAVGPDRADAVFRALTRALHPDVAHGDTVLMQELNAARERAAFSRRSAS